MIENLENEQWLSIENYEELYQVSNYGRIKSLNYRNTNQEQILKPSTNNNGYQVVRLCKDGKPKTVFVHRLVANAFIPNYNNLPQVNHKDENKCNNHVDNLEWCTTKYNINYGTARERQSKTISGENNPLYGKFGKEHNRSKQVIQLTLGGDYIKTWNSMMDIQRELNYYHGNIGSCCKNKRKSAYGYKWTYT